MVIGEKVSSKLWRHPEKGEEVYRCEGSLESKEEWSWLGGTQDESTREEDLSLDLSEWNSEDIPQLHTKELGSGEDCASIGGGLRTEEA